MLYRQCMEYKSKGNIVTTEDKKPAVKKKASKPKKAATKTKKAKSPAKAKKIQSSDSYALPSRVDIASIGTIFEEVKASFAGKDIIFDASGVDHITTPGVQLFLASSVTAKERGGEISISNPSEEFQNIISDLGFSNQLKEWMGSND